MSAASLLTSVPVTPIATPMSARRSAGASFTPSPVIETTAPRRRQASTMRSFCSGLVRAYTATSATIASKRGVVELLELGAGQAASAVAQDTDPPGDGVGRQWVIARDHDWRDARRTARGDGRGRGLARRVCHPDDPQKAEAVLGVVEPGGDVVDRALRQREYAVSIGGVAFGDALGPPQQVSLGRIEERSDRLQGALHGDPDLATSRVDGRHPSPLGVERQLFDPRPCGGDRASTPRAWRRGRGGPPRSDRR